VSGVCPHCARRGWLLGKLSSRLDYCARELGRFWSVLELPDEELIEAIGGRRRDELHGAYASVNSASLSDGHGGEVQAFCRHHPAYPDSLREIALAPHVLHVSGGIERLGLLLEQPLAAIVGTRRASDYGMETARGLARGLAASGVTVTSNLCEGIALAVHSGALEAHGATLTVMAGGVRRYSPARCAPLYRRLTSVGCAISEMPPNMRGRAWCEPAHARTLALLARLVIVVEAEERPWALACAEVAQRFEKIVAAVPGRVSSPTSQGANALLMRGARLVRNPQDALDALYGVTGQWVPVPSVVEEPRLRAVLEEVGAGRDTIAKLTDNGASSADVALALLELELRGLVVRGDAGRYLPGTGLPAG
jgi:DNA processing protein